VSDSNPNPAEKVLKALQERTKELNCLYEVEKHLNDVDAPLEQTLMRVVTTIPKGWQFPEDCRARVSYEGKTYQLPDCQETPWGQCAPIYSQGRSVGMLCVYYLTAKPAADIGAFLSEEARLISTMADRLGHYLQHLSLRHLFDDFKHAEDEIASKSRGEWRGAVRLLRNTDQNLYVRISRKLMNHLCWSGDEEAQRVQQQVGDEPESDDASLDANVPQERRAFDARFYLSEAPFALAAQSMTDEEILARVERWIFEDKSSVLV